MLFEGARYGFRLGRLGQILYIMGNRFMIRMTILFDDEVDNYDADDDDDEDDDDNDDLTDDNYEDYDVDGDYNRNYDDNIAQL